MAAPYRTFLRQGPGETLIPHYAMQGGVGGLRPPTPCDRHLYQLAMSHNSESHPEGL